MLLWSLKNEAGWGLDGTHLDYGRVSAGLAQVHPEQGPPADVAVGSQVVVQVQFSYGFLFGTGTSFRRWRFRRDPDGFVDAGPVEAPCKWDK